jgi:DNA-directed RNA polymerase specialized sigma24 family protein
MFGRKKRNNRQYSSEHATGDDFQQIFSEDMAGLHLLASLLTGDETQAEQIFVAGLEDSINGNPVFRQWARSWSRRAIIKRAIRSVAPSPADAAVNTEIRQPETGNGNLNILLAAVATLSPFQRFVFVLSVLEGYSISECAMLLACTLADVVSARSAALQQIASLERELLAVETTAAAVAASWWKMLFKTARAS